MEISAGRDVDIDGDVVGGDMVVAGRDMVAEKRDGSSKKKWLVKLAAAIGLQGPLMVLVDWIQELVR